MTSQARQEELLMAAATGEIKLSLSELKAVADSVESEELLVEAVVLSYERDLAMFEWFARNGYLDEDDYLEEICRGEREGMEYYIDMLLELGARLREELLLYALEYSNFGIFGHLAKLWGGGELSERVLREAERAGPAALSELLPRNRGSADTTRSAT